MRQKKTMRVFAQGWCRSYSPDLWGGPWELCRGEDDYPLVIFHIAAIAMENGDLVRWFTDLPIKHGDFP